MAYENCNNKKIKKSMTLEPYASQFTIGQSGISGIYTHVYDCEHTSGKQNGMETAHDCHIPRLTPNHGH